MSFKSFFFPKGNSYQPLGETPPPAVLSPQPSTPDEEEEVDTLPRRIQPPTKPQLAGKSRRRHRRVRTLHKRRKSSKVRKTRYRRTHSRTRR